MKLWIAPYKLWSHRPLNRTETAAPGEGFLVKLQTKEYRSGYADCRPWALFGDQSVEQQVQLLKQRRLSPILKRSVFFAHIDGMARERKKTLWTSFLKIRSHYTVSDVIELRDVETLSKLRDQGYRTLKIKLGRDHDAEAAVCNTVAEKNWFHFRLDFNGQGGEAFLNRVSALFLSQVDFCEDPEPYQEIQWERLEKKFSVRCAVDQPPLVDLKIFAKRLRVIKPARQNQLARRQDVITNSMDHPIGQSFAALQAQESLLRFEKQFTDYGLKTDHLFKTNEYFDRLRSETCIFKPDLQTGIGFDDLLERETWIPL